MNEWEAQYKALCMGIQNKEHIENAEKLVTIAIRLSQVSMESLDSTLSAMIVATRHFQHEDNKNLFIDE